VVAITDLPAGALANVTVTDPNGQQTTLTSSQTISAIPGTYTVTAAPVIVGTSTYNAMLPTQTAVVTTGNTANATVDYKNVVPATTKVLDSPALSSLSVSSDGLTLAMSASSPVAQSLAVGDVIIVPPTSTSGVAPMGMLRKVVSTSSSNSQVVATTQLGTLSDAFQRVSFQVQTQLTTATIQAVHTAPGVKFRPGASLRRPLSSGRAQDSSSALSDPCGGYFIGVFDVPESIQISPVPGLTLSGSVEVCSGLNFSVDITGTGPLGITPTLNSLTATASMGEYSDLTLQGDLLTGSFNPDPTVIAVIDGPAIPVPGLEFVWVTPEVSIFYGADGNITSGVSTEVSSSGSFTGGVTYASGNWTPVFTHSLQFGYQPPTLDASLSAKAYAGVEFDLYVYDLIGPSFTPDAYLDLEANIANNPWWTLTGGLEGPMSLDVTFLGENLVAPIPLGTLFDYSYPIISATGPFSPPANNPVPTISSLSPVSLAVNSAPQTLTINGAGFITTSTVTFNGINHSAAFLSANQLTISLISADLAMPGTYPVVVTNPAPGGGTSSAANFSVTSTSYTLLHSFSGSDGVCPVGIVQGSDGTIYGTTASGGSNKDGVLYEINPSGTFNFSVLHTFTGADGAMPLGKLIFGSDGVTLYGTSEAGENGAGTVFGFDTVTQAFNMLYPFAGLDGAEPMAGLTLATDGTLYGTTYEGGGDSSGEVFNISPSGGFTEVHMFQGSPGDGGAPVASLAQGTDGYLYGTTLGGGTPTGGGGNGTIFKMDTSGNESFVNDLSGGSAAFAGLLLGKDGYFYGVSGGGGTSSWGYAYRIDTQGNFTILHSFTANGVDGALPTTPLIQGSDGYFYGFTTAGGIANDGTVFRMDSSGNVDLLYSFSSFVGPSQAGGNNIGEASVQWGWLIQGLDGNFYGTTCGGGSSSDGTIFRLAVGP
jgi:uncharacterized repeat protein (TIGR03803 family)